MEENKLTIRVRTKTCIEKIDIDEEEKRNFKAEQNYMELTILEKSIEMDLKEIINKIQEGIEEYIFDFIRHPVIAELTKGIYGLYKFNRDEVSDIISFSITEFFYINKVDIESNDFDEELFLFDLKKSIRTAVQKHIREGYSAKEYPSSDWSKYENTIAERIEMDQVNIKIDVKKAINKLSSETKEILKLYYIDKYNQTEIAAKLNITQMQVSRILFRLQINLKELLNN